MSRGARPDRSVDSLAHARAADIYSLDASLHLTKTTGVLPNAMNTVRALLQHTIGSDGKANPKEGGIVTEDSLAPKVAVLFDCLRLAATTQIMLLLYGLGTARGRRVRTRGAHSRVARPQTCWRSRIAP